MTVLIIQIAAVVILITLSAFFSSSETALTTLSPHRVRSLVDEGVKKADILEKVLDDGNRMLSVILICNNIVNLTASSITTMIFQKVFGSSSVGIGTGILTLLVLIFGEVAPKTMATIRAEKMSLRFCRIIWFLMKIFAWLAAIINFLAGGILKVFGVKKDEKAETITEGELRTIVEVSQESGIIESSQKTFIDNIFDFSDKSAHEIMVPRINIVSINIDSTYDEIMQVFEENFFTRYPVYDKDGEKIIGLVNIKDLAFLPADRRLDFKVKDVLRQVFYTFEQKRLKELFVEMKKNSASLMVVLDEYGDVAGIVSMEDILEELVGDIRDEYDADEDLEIVCIGKDSYLIQGHVSLDDINEKLGTEFESEEYDSIGGLLMEKLDRIPEENDSVCAAGCVLTAYKTDNTKIELVKVVL